MCGSPTGEPMVRPRGNPWFPRGAPPSHLTGPIAWWAALGRSPAPPIGAKVDPNVRFGSDRRPVRHVVTPELFPSHVTAPMHGWAALGQGPAPLPAPAVIRRYGSVQIAGL